MATRAEKRIETTEAILAVARRHLAEVGPAALSLRAVTRDVGMVSSAVYRYFASRDELLTALIIEAYDAVGTAAEDADASVADRGDHLGRWLAVTGAVRSWAVANPHQYALVYGSPVPGYAAPPDTVSPAARVSLVFLGLLADAGLADDAEVPPSLAPDFARLRELAPGVPDGVLSRGLLAWTAMYGHISYELFGHLHRVIDDYDAFFDLQMRRLGEWLLTG